MADSNGGVKREADDGVEHVAKKLRAETMAKDERECTNLPYRNIPYQEQLEKKQTEVEELFKGFCSAFLKRYPNFTSWYKDVFLTTRFRLDPIMRSPKTFAYRNKCELTIGYNPELGKLCAGPRISNSEDGKVQVGPCNEELVHLPPAMIEIAQDFSNFLDKWNYLEEKCPWFNLFIRSTKTGNHMLIVIVREDSQEVLKERKNELVKYYTEDYTLKHAVKSIFIQPRAEDSTKKSFELEFLLAHGEEYLVEDLLDIKLVVTPGIFFRINTYAAEVVYQKTLDVGDLLRRKTVVIDLWCGCGELSLLAAKRSHYVIGIDPSKWNIKKAQFMARYNKIRNIEFIIAKPEDGLKQIWSQLPTAEEIVIIADPPTLYKMLLLGDMVAEMPNLKRFIYLYSTHKLHLVKNMITLTDASLLPTRIIPVDVSPHNVRLELIAVLKKVDPNEQPPQPLAPLPPPADWIEEIERRAFAMGMAKALAAAPASNPLRRPPALMDEDYGYEEGFGGFGAAGRGAGTARGYGTAGRGAAAAKGFGGAGRGKFGGGAAALVSGFGGGYDEYEEVSGGFGAGRSRFGGASAGFGGAGYGGGQEAYGAGRGFRGGARDAGGRGTTSAPLGAGYGAERKKFGFGGPGLGAVGGRFGSAKSSGGFQASRGGFDTGYEDFSSGAGFGRDGFGRSGFSLDIPDTSFSGGFGGGRGRVGGGRGGRGAR